MTRPLLVLHVIAGSAALLSMIVPMVSRKGGSLHRRAGWVFVGGMSIVTISALVLSAVRILTDPTANGRTFGLFLFYLAVLTGGGLSAGIRVLRFKQRTSAHHHRWDLAAAAMVGASGVGIGLYGLTMRQPLLVAFSLVGVVNGTTQLAYWLRPPSHPMHWWFEHMNLMLSSCIAATTAFLVNSAGLLGLPGSSLVVWLTPTVVGVPSIAIWITYYRRRFAGSSRRPAGRLAIRGAVATTRIVAQ